MLTYVFDESGVPLYEQAYRCIKMILSAEICAPERSFRPREHLRIITALAPSRFRMLMTSL